ncbi:DinB family protein [Kineosporia succinea]
MIPMTRDMKSKLQEYLDETRDALVWKLEGLSEYDLRRPVVPTGTNLLGILKHVASVEAGYLGSVFGRPFADEPFPWLEDDAEPDGDFYATADETPEQFFDLYRRVRAHSDATIAALPLDATGTVSWWQAGHNTVTLEQIIVHMIYETGRHAGHADIVRELIDGAVGRLPGKTNLPDVTDAERTTRRDKLEELARRFA